MKAYLCGPMSHIPQCNFPAFYDAAAKLRESGWDIVSPAELDAEHGVDKQAMASVNGNPADLSESWGTMLARDVKLIADGGIEAIVFLPNWTKSRGAKLEATVGLLKGLSFYEWAGSEPRRMDSTRVATYIYIEHCGDLRKAV